MWSSHCVPHKIKQEKHFYTTSASSWIRKFKNGTHNVVTPGVSTSATAALRDKRLYTSSPTRAQALVVQSGAIPLVWSGPTLALYDLAPGHDGKWTQQGSAVDLGIPAANGAISENTVYQKAPHPLSDLQLARAGARTIAAAVWIEPGKSRVWIASRPDSAGSDQRRGWTTWSAVAPPR